MPKNIVRVPRPPTRKGYWSIVRKPTKKGGGFGLCSPIMYYTKEKADACIAEHGWQSWACSVFIGPDGKMVKGGKDGE